MEAVQIIYGKYVLADPTDAENGLIKDGAVAICGTDILEVGLKKDLLERYPDAGVSGSDKDFIMPGIIDAHSHGRGISYVQKGIPYDFLENNLFDWVDIPNLPEELDAPLMAIKHIRNGSTTIHVNKSFGPMCEGAYESSLKTMEGYRKAGMRLVYSPGTKDVNQLANDDETFYELLPKDLKAAVRSQVYFDKDAARNAYCDLFDSLRRDCHNEMTNVILGPFWAHGCTDAFYEKLLMLQKKHGGVPMHIHTMQTPHQNAYGYRKYGKSLLRHMDDIGVVNEHLVLGHAVYLNEEDMDVMASRKASMTHHASCNLIMRNGIAPVYELTKKGVNVALGMDEKQINDDEDALHELRMIFYLHRCSGYELDRTPYLAPSQVLSIGTANGAKAVGLEGRIGKLKPHMAADLICVDLVPILEEPWCAEEADILNTFIHRAMGRYTKHVWINGEQVMRDGQILTIDVPALYEEVRDRMNHLFPYQVTEKMEAMRRVQKYYNAYNRELIRTSGDVFYQMNKR